MDNDHHDSFGDFLGGLFQLFLLGAIIYLLFLAIWGILKFIWFIFGWIWKLIKWICSQIKKHAALRYRINKLDLAIHAFFLRHPNFNKFILRIRNYFLIFWTSKPSEIFFKLKRGAVNK